MFKGNQYILAKVTVDGKKLPVGQDLKAINAHDPQHWMPYETAQAMATALGCMVAFVITKEDPYFCIDIDHCLLPDGQTWSPLAQKLCTEFREAYIEVSLSGKALHIWGSCLNPPLHRCKNVPLDLELYTEGRFIILGSNGRGDPDLDYSVALRKFVQEYMPPSEASLAKNGRGFEWTVEPVAEWNETEDDDELIEKACKHKSLGSNFDSSKITFEDLWERNVHKLAAAWPSGNPDREFDYSSADMSLAQRLAYWTGKNCERVQRIMFKSGLYRDKWEQRPDYMERTILNACANQAQVACLPETKDGVSRKFAGGWVGADEIPEVFEGCTYIVGEHRALVPSGARVKPEQFKVLYGGYKFAVDDGRTTRNAWEAFTECPTWRPPTADRVCFRPECEAGAMIDTGSELMVNMYHPVNPPRVKGDVSRLLRLFELNYPDPHDREILMSYMAAIVQYPGVKFQWAPLLQGPEGNGKTFLIKCVREAVGTRYCHTLDASALKDTGMKFNDWLFAKIFISVEEIRVGSNDIVMEILKGLSNDTVEIQGKGANQFMADNRANFIFTSNYLDALKIKDGDRRYCPIMSQPQSAADLTEMGLTPEFFRELWDWFRGTAEFKGQTAGAYHVTEWLSTYPIAKGYNPALDCVRAPKSSNHSRFLAASAGRIEQEIFEAIEQGRSGFRGGYVSTMALDSLFYSARLPATSHIKRKEILQGMGYIPHPNLPNGRTNGVVMPDGGRPRLWILEGSLLANMTDAKSIAAHYEKAQITEAALDVFGNTQKT